MTGPSPSLAMIAARYGSTFAEVALMAVEAAAEVHLDTTTLAALKIALDGWVIRGGPGRPSLPIDITLGAAQPSVRKALARVAGGLRSRPRRHPQGHGRRRTRHFLRERAPGAQKFGLLAEMGDRPVGGAAVLLLECILGARLDVIAAVAVAEAVAAWAAAGAPGRGRNTE